MARKKTAHDQLAEHEQRIAEAHRAEREAEAKLAAAEAALEDARDAVRESHDLGQDPAKPTRRLERAKRGVEQAIDPLVPEDLADDFREAAAILDKSHRMSAVLARRILADLLERYAALRQFSLTTRIDKFIADTSRPRDLRENPLPPRDRGLLCPHANGRPASPA